MDKLKKIITEFIKENPVTEWNKIFKLSADFCKEEKINISDEVIKNFCMKFIVESKERFIKNQLEFANIENDTEIIHLEESAKEHLKTISKEKHSTGISELDYILDGGLQIEHVAIISGYTGEGKSLFAMYITAEMLKKGASVLWFQFELTPSEFWNKYESLGVTSNMKVYVPSVYATATMDWVELTILKSKLLGVEIVVFDLLDFLQTDKNKKADKNQEDAEIVARLKKMASKYKVAIILMAHMRKPQITKYENSPDVHDIRGAGAISGLANWVLTVYRIKKENKNIEDKLTKYSEFAVRKNRINGILKSFYGAYENGILTIAKYDDVEQAKKNDDLLQAHAELQKKYPLK